MLSTSVIVYVGE